MTDPRAAKPPREPVVTLPNAPSATSVVQRPALVTAALVLLYVGALVSVVLGVLVLLSRYRVAAGQVVPVSLVGAGIALVGLLALAVTSAVGRGERRARLAVTVWMGALAALQIAAIAVTDEVDAWALVPLGLEALVVVALWLPASSRWFRASTPAR